MLKIHGTLRGTGLNTAILAPMIDLTRAPFPAFLPIIGISAQFTDERER